MAEGAGRSGTAAWAVLGRRVIALDLEAPSPHCQHVQGRPLRAHASDLLSQATAGESLDKESEEQLGRSIVLDLIEAAMAEDANTGRPAWSLARQRATAAAVFDSLFRLGRHQDFADYPMRVPAGKFDPWSRSEPEWMLLSYGGTAMASSSAPSHGPELATDEDIRTWWVADETTAGEWLQVDLGNVVDVAAIQVNVADHRSVDYAPSAETEGKDFFGHAWRGIFPEHGAASYHIEGSTDGQNWPTLADDPEDGSHGLFVLDETQEQRHVRVTGRTMPFGAPFALSVRVFGRGRLVGSRSGLSFCYLTNGQDRNPIRQARRVRELSAAAAACIG